MPAGVSLGVGDLDLLRRLFEDERGCGTSNDYKESRSCSIQPEHKHSSIQCMPQIACCYIAKY